MLSNKLTFSLASLVFLLIAAMVITPSVVYADPPEFTLKSAKIAGADLSSGGMYRVNDEIVIVVTADTIDDGQPKLATSSTASDVKIAITIGTTNAGASPPTTAFTREAIFDGTFTPVTGQPTQADMEFTYTIAPGDSTTTVAPASGVGINIALAVAGFANITDSSSPTPIPSNGSSIAQSSPSTTVADSTARIDAPDLGVPTLTTIPLSGMVPSKGFLVIGHTGASASDTGLSLSSAQYTSVSGLPNLNTLFQGNGGTLELTGAAKGPIITEIMWGEDLSASDVRYSQWIEIYNASGAAINLSNYGLKITPYMPGGFTADAMAVDTVSNLGNGRWSVPGNGGRSMAVAATTTSVAQAAMPLVSMHRPIDYTKAKVDDKGTAADATDDVLKDVNDGTLSGSWAASAPPSFNIGANRVATPGAKHVTQLTAGDATSIPYSPIIINEIGNSTTKANKWIELRNVSTGEVNLKKWELNVITAHDTEVSLVSFPDKDYKLGAGKILLIVNKDPIDTPLARGMKLGDKDGMTVDADQENRGVKSDGLFYDADSGLNNLPDNGKFLLVVRNANDKKKSHEKIIDITGTLYLPDASRSTDLWPLRATGAGHGNVIDGTDTEEFAAGSVYNRKDPAGGTGEKDWGVASFTGIGYDRDVPMAGAYGGTPGFPNDSLKEKPADILDAVSISEIMVESNEGRYPQWIELRNTHMTNGVNLDAWKLRVENVGEVDARRQVTIDLPNGYRLAPNQTILIATRRGTASDDLTASRVIVLYNDRDARQALEVDSPRYTLLSKEGFTLKLYGKDQALTATPVDTVTVSADQLTEAMIGDRTERVSLIRYYSTGIPGRLGSSRDSNQVINALSVQYYGVSDDIGTPGWYPGGALPVSLSSFRPERDKATGEVVVRWVTQSELNNAGFNILRSETKNGEFTVVNVKGIVPGHGTTSERHVYTWTDTTAKPNVVYYYQIEDVSLDGERTTLATTHLRGNVNAAGKLTTTWGDLKTQ